MDPLTIATGAAGLIAVATRVSGYIFTWVAKTKTVDANVNGLQTEVKALTNVLCAMESSFQDETMTTATLANRTGYEAQHWRNVRTSLTDCRTTLTNLETIWGNVARNESKSFFGRQKKLLSMAINMEEITILRTQVASYRQTMNLSLQLLTV
jgi:hypothetical protein